MSLFSLTVNGNNETKLNQNQILVLFKIYVKWL